MNGRDTRKTNHLSDFDLAVRFNHDFNVDENFGKVIPNAVFENWIISLNFKHMIRISDDQANKNSWNHHRKTIRQYIKNGVLTKKYRDRKLSHPFCLDVNEHGQNIIIVRLEDSVIQACNDLTRKRKQNIRYQNRIFKKDFDGIINLFEMDKVEAIMQKHLLEAHNKIRVAMEQSFGDIMHTTVNDTLKSIAASQQKIRELSLFDDEEEDDDDDNTDTDNENRER